MAKAKTTAAPAAAPVSGKEGKIKAAIGMVKAKADYRSSVFPNTDTSGKAIKNQTVKDANGKDVVKSGADAKNVYYNRRYSIIGSKMSKATDANHAAAIEVLKKFGAMSGPNQASAAYDTLEALMSAYGTDGKGGKKKLATETKVEFSF